MLGEMTRLSERAMRGREPEPPHIRWPLRMLRHILETPPIAANPLAEIHFRLECIRALEGQIAAARYAYMWPGWTVQRRAALSPLICTGI